MVRCTSKDITSYICTGIGLAGGVAMLVIGAINVEPILIITGAILIGIITIMYVMLCFIHKCMRISEEIEEVVRGNPAVVVPVEEDPV